MLTLKVNCSDFTDAIKKMSIPTVGQKDSFFFPFIAPKIYPNGVMEWIAKSANVTSWIRVKYTMPMGLTEPIRIPMEAKMFLKTLESFSGTDLITFVHDTEKEQYIFSNSDDGNGRTILVPATSPATIIKEIYEAFPVGFEPDTEIIMLRGGALKTDISAKCDIKLFNEVISNVAKITNSTKKENVQPVYHIFIDEDLKRIKTVAGNENDRQHETRIDVIVNESVTGHGSLHYSLGFADVCNVLSGEIEFHSVDKGPLWLMHDNDRVITRYFIPPATYKE